MPRSDPERSNYLVLSLAARNGDAHQKAFGLLYAHPQAERPRLAPLYDMVTTAATTTSTRVPAPCTPTARWR